MSVCSVHLDLPREEFHGSTEWLNTGKSVELPRVTCTPGSHAWWVGAIGGQRRGRSHFDPTACQRARQPHALARELTDLRRIAGDFVILIAIHQQIFRPITHAYSGALCSASIRVRMSAIAMRVGDNPGKSLRWNDRIHLLLIVRSLRRPAAGNHSSYTCEDCGEDQ